MIEAAWHERDTGIRVLGIDPGSRVTGYGIIDVHRNRMTYVDSGCIRTGEGTLPERLKVIFDCIQQLDQTHQPDVAAIEQVFMHRNADSALKLGQARAAAMSALFARDVPIMEYAARQVKQALVGRGGAEKNQVQHMVQVLLKLTSKPQLDASDALAVAMCHAHHQSGLTQKISESGVSCA